ncbi:PAS domain S-box protein [Streptomyces sp. RB6PN25]|uniref:PAS domain S-box protein n=2 Tax=Streptomyces humicola TaxID=2953240 RepID=A0ABT1PVR2_9ACTN|nr:PAS domain S-box protein [Streptomyces humicola]
MQDYRFDITDAAVVVVDSHGLVQQWNSGAESLFGYPSTQVAARSSRTCWGSRRPG